MSLCCIPWISKSVYKYSSIIISFNFKVTNILPMGLFSWVKKWRRWNTLPKYIILASFVWCWNNTYFVHTYINHKEISHVWNSSYFKEQRNKVHLWKGIVLKENIPFEIFLSFSFSFFYFAVIIFWYLSRLCCCEFSFFCIILNI